MKLLFAILFGPFIGMVGMAIRFFNFLRYEINMLIGYTRTKRLPVYAYGVYVFALLIIPVMIYGLLTGPFIVYMDDCSV